MRKKIKFEIGVFDKKLPIFAFGFVSPNEFVFCIWIVTFRISLGY